MPDGHLGALDLDAQFAKEQCISAALCIYTLAKKYGETYTFRRAPYLFSYAVFSAATVFPMDSENFESRSSIIKFFWMALKQLQQGANSGLKRSISVIHNMFERAGIDMDKICAAATNDHPFVSTPNHVVNSLDASDNQEVYEPSLANLDASTFDPFGNEDYQNLYRELMADDIFSAGTGDLYNSAESLYGLVQSGGSDM